MKVMFEIFLLHQIRYPRLFFSYLPTGFIYIISPQSISMNFTVLYASTHTHTHAHTQANFFLSFL